MIDKTLLPQLAAEALTHGDKFSESFGFRARPSLDGSFGSYSTLKYFAMPKPLRTTVKKAVQDLDSNIETYFLKFEEGQKLPMIKSHDDCFFICKSVLIHGEADVTYKSEVFNLTEGDELEIEPRYAHEILPKGQCIFLVELQITEI